MMRQQRGFTLVEAMVIVAIIAIIASVAMPSLLESIRSARTRNTSDQIVQLLNLTRSESLNKNANHIFSVEESGLCVTRKGEDQCAVKLETIPSGVTVTGDAAEFTGIFGTPAVVTGYTFDVSGEAGASSFEIDVNMLGLITRVKK